MQKTDPETVLVTEIESSNSFHVQPQATAQELEKVMQTLAKSNGAGSAAFTPKVCTLAPCLLVRVARALAIASTR